MKKYIYSFLIILTCICHVDYLSAQVSDMTFQRLVKNSALNKLDEYRAYHSMGDEEAYFEFLDLFVNDSAQVYNDQLGLGGKQQITVKEYADRQRKKLQSPMIHFSNVKINRVWKENDKWKVEISFNKSASYINACGISFSSMDFYGKYYDEKAVLVFNDDDDLRTCKIESISGNIDSSRHLADNYLIFIKSSERDEQIRYLSKAGKKQNLEFNSFDQVLFEEGAKVSDFSYSDPDVSLKPVINEECHTMQMQYKARCWRIRPHFDIAIGDYYKFETTDSKIETSSKGSEFGVDFGYTIPSKSIFKLSINTGLGIAISNFDLNTPAWKFSYLASSKADIDENSYSRYYEIGATRQSNSLTHFDIPIYADADICFNKKISAYFQVGLKSYMKLSEKIKDFNSSDYIYGIYPQYDNLRLDEHWLQDNGTPYNGFGSHNITIADIKNPTFSTKGFTMDFFGGFGLRLKPFKTLPLAFELGMQYQMSLLDMLDTNVNGLSLSDGIISSQYAITSYTKSGGEDRRLLSDGLSGMKRSHITLNIGLIYKF